jgi:type IV secretory pathway VirB3-like protein
MATRCIDIAENKKIGQTSPIAMFVFVALFVILSAVMSFGFLYLILVLLAYVLSQIFFQFSPRFISLSLKFILKNSYLTPSFKDHDYLEAEYKIKNIKRVLVEEE